MARKKDPMTWARFTRPPFVTLVSLASAIGTAALELGSSGVPVYVICVIGALTDCARAMMSGRVGSVDFEGLGVKFNVKSAPRRARKQIPAPTPPKQLPGNENGSTKQLPDKGDGGDAK